MSDNVCEEKVFSNIYNEYSKDLHNFLYYKYGGQFDPDDKVQDAFVKLWKKCKDVTLSKAKGFVFMVAKNMMLNEIKHQKNSIKTSRDQTKGLYE